MQHLVGGGTDAGYEVRRIEGRLFNFGETVSVIRIQHDSASEQIRRWASSLCVALVTKSKPVEALGDLLLSDLLPALHALHELIDFVALLREGWVVLISFAGLALRGLGGTL